MGLVTAGLKTCRYVAACSYARGGRSLGLLCLSGAALAATGSSVWDGVYTPEQAKRGESAYLQACASCHGTGLEGGDMTPPLVGGAFTSNWNDLTAGDLFERIRTTMPLDAPGRLSRPQTADVIAFILKANGWPAGTGELPADPGALKQVRIEAAKVQ